MFVDCTRPYARPLLDCFFDKGIHVSIKSLTETKDLPKVLTIRVHRIGIVLFIDDIDLNAENNLLHKVNNIYFITQEVSHIFRL